MIENPIEEQLKTLKNIVYMLTDKRNGMKYVGQTTKSFKKRYTGNWTKNINGNEFLRNVVSKHGKETFLISILEYNISSVEEMDNIEDFYIIKYNSIYPTGYNFKRGGHNNFGLSSHTKQRIGESNAKKVFFLKNNITNEIIEIKNLSKFCRANNLNRGEIQKILNGTRVNNNYKEWTKPNESAKFWEFQSPDGKTYKVFRGDLLKFARKQFLGNSIIKLANSEIKTYKGWRKIHTSIF